MISYYEFENHFSHLPREQVDILQEIRSIVARIAPDCTEVFHPYGISYFHGNQGGPVKSGICQVGIKPDHIRLGLVFGAFLPDPHHLLQGTQKAMRWIKIISFEQTPWEDVAELIACSSRFDPYTLALE
jgi:hypothetical protein